MASEVELKLSVDPRMLRGDGAAARIAQHPAIAKVRHGRARIARVVSTYYDTADLKLARHGIVLRLRRDGTRWLQTVKGPPLPGSGAGLHARSEYERHLARPVFDAAHLATTPWHRVLTKALRRKSLVPQFTTDFVRHAVPIAFPGGSHATLAIDSGWIRAGRRTSRIAEIEIEIDAGNPLPLFGLAQELAADLPVTVASTNKAERGYALARGAADGPGEPVHASAAELGDDPSAEDALRNIARGCLAQIEGNAPGLCADTDPEWVHQMRIGTRRLRSCLGLMPATPPRDALIAEVKWLATLLGNARDWDVFATETLPPVIAAIGTDTAASESFGRLRQRVSVRRVRARAEVRDAIRSPRFTRLMLACGALSAMPHFGRRDDEALQVLASPARGFAEVLIERRHHKLVGKAADLVHASPKERHKARIAAKKLRYAAEFFASLFSGKRARHYLATLSSLQDVLGHANDAETVHHLVESLPGTGDAAMVGAIRGWAAANAVTLEKEIARVAGRFADSRRFWVGR